MSNHPLESPSTAYGKLDEQLYKAELQLADQYQAFTAELLRLALLGIAAFGFLSKEVFFNSSYPKPPSLDTAKYLASYGIGFFGRRPFSL